MEKLKVLIVDDETEISDFIKIKLASIAPHLKIAQVESGYECLEYLKQDGADCILSDYQMPGMDGMELLKELRAAGRKTPFIFITGQGNEEVASEAFKNGASDYFTKEIGFAHFPRIVNSVGRAVRGRREQEEREKAEVSRDENERRLRESEERYRLLFENNPNPMLVYDTDTLEMLAVNDAAVIHYGYSREEFLKISAKDMRPAEDIEKFLSYIKQRSGEEYRQGVWRHRKKDGTVIDVHISSHSISFEGRSARAVLINDITEQKKAEGALRESEDKFRRLVESSLVGIFIIKDITRDRRIVYSNPHFRRMLGYTEEELRELNIASLLHPDELPIVRESHKKRFSGETDDINFQSRWLRKDGGIIDVEVFGTVIEYEGSQAVFGEALDITERRRAEEERSAMFHMLTHDIRGPLSVIYGYGSLASQLKGEEAAEVIADIQKAAKKIYAIIDNILSLSRLESREAELIIQQAFLPELVYQAVRENEAAAAEKGIEVEASAEGGLPMIYCDSAQLARAIGNLVSNAVNYNRRGGKVDVRSGPAGNGREVYVEVSDTGDGIDEEDLPRIFDKYYRGKKAGKKKGTGLGLAIVKAVAEGHGGRVEVKKAKKGEGCTFRLVLPVKPGL